MRARLPKLRGPQGSRGAPRQPPPKAGHGGSFRGLSAVSSRLARAAPAAWTTDRHVAASGAFSRCDWVAVPTRHAGGPPTSLPPRPAPEPGRKQGGPASRAPGTAGCHVSPRVVDSTLYASIVPIKAADSAVAPERSCGLPRSPGE